MKTYLFEVALEQDGEGWRAFFPDWEEIGASTWGYTQEEALGHIQEVLAMIVEEFKEDASAMPATKRMTVSEGASIAVTI